MKKENPDELFEKEVIVEDEGEKLFREEKEEVVAKEEKKKPPSTKPKEAWKVLVVDDEEDVHSVTRMALKGFIFQDRKIEFLDTYSARESQKVIRKNPDIAVILLDVVMETNNAGLELVKYIRDKAGNHFTQIILRTGYPGQAPEREVIVSYEINDYKTKTELTAFKLFTVVLASLRAYDSVMKLESLRQGLEEKVRERTAEIAQKNIKLEQQKKKILTANEELNVQKEELQSTLENLKQTQSQLVQSEKMASVGQLTAGIAHEINNPVTFISGNVKPLIRDIKDIFAIINEYDSIVHKKNLQEKFKKVKYLKDKLDFSLISKEINNLLKGINEGANRTTEIVKGLRTFSRLDEDVLKIVDIHEGLDSTLILLRNEYKNRIEIIKEYGDIPHIECYPGKLNQVFMNILSNSIDAIEDKGAITIKTSKSKEYLQLSIKDTGKGMSEKVKSKVFEPFFTTKDVGKGTGLGLSIVLGIIEKHKGKIEVKSEIGEGTEFIISLPLQQA